MSDLYKQRRSGYDDQREGKADPNEARRSLGYRQGTADAARDQQRERERAERDQYWSDHRDSAARESQARADQERALREESWRDRTYGGGTPTTPPDTSAKESGWNDLLILVGGAIFWILACWLIFAVLLPRLAQG